MDSIFKTDFSFPGQTSKYEGKVRDVYTIKDDKLVIIASDRISAFDIVMPRSIPNKGQVLNQISVEMLNSTKDIIDNWLISSPDPNVSIGHRLNPIKIEMVIRGYLSGHADRLYKSGKRSICGVNLPNGLVSNQKFDRPIITPSTKADIGHDEDISKEDIIEEQRYTFRSNWTVFFVLIIGLILVLILITLLGFFIYGVLGVPITLDLSHLPE